MRKSNMTVLVIGLNPGRVGKIQGSALSRLFYWMSRCDVQYFSFINLSQQPGKFDHSTADIDLISSLAKNYDRVITLGAIVDSVMTKCGVEHMAMPHPSGLNRLLNDRDFECRMITECREWLK